MHFCTQHPDWSHSHSFWLFILFLLFCRTNRFTGYLRFSSRFILRFNKWFVSWLYSVLCGTVDYSLLRFRNRRFSFSFGSLTFVSFWTFSDFLVSDFFPGFFSSLRIYSSFKIFDLKKKIKIEFGEKRERKRAAKLKRLRRVFSFSSTGPP